MEIYDILIAKQCARSSPYFVSPGTSTQADCERLALSEPRFLELLRGVKEAIELCNSTLGIDLSSPNQIAIA